MRKYLKKALGIVLIILGFLALITPCSPGSWLILVGLEFLGLGFLLEDKLPAFLKVRYKGRFRNLFKKPGEDARMSITGQNIKSTMLRCIPIKVYLGTPYGGKLAK